MQGIENEWLSTIKDIKLGVNSLLSLEERKYREKKKYYVLKKLKDLNNEHEVFIYSPGALILYELFNNKVNLENLSWRDFEKLIAELLEKEGFEVTLNKGTKDGGADIIAKRKLSVTGYEITIWQAKCYKKNKIGINAIRELSDVRQQIGGHKGFMVTTSYLTKGALDRITKDLYLGKKDKDDVKLWINEIWEKGI